MAEILKQSENSVYMYLFGLIPFGIIIEIISFCYQFIEYYTLLTRRRLRVKDKQNDNKDRKPVKEKDTKVKSQQKDIFRKNKEKNDERKKQKKEPIKLRKMNPHAAYGKPEIFL